MGRIVYIGIFVWRAESSTVSTKKQLINLKIVEKSIKIKIIWKFKKK